MKRPLFCFCRDARAPARPASTVRAHTNGGGGGESAGQKRETPRNAPKVGQRKAEGPAPPTASPREGRRRLACRPSEAAQAPGLGPTSARRGLCGNAPDRGGHGGPPGLSITGRLRVRGPGARPPAPAAPGSLPGFSFSPLRRLAERRRAKTRGPALPPAAPERRPKRHAAAGPFRRRNPWRGTACPPEGERPAGRAPPPAPEAGRRRDPSRHRGAPEVCRSAKPLRHPRPHSRDRRRFAPPSCPSASTRPAGRRTAAEPGGTARSPRFHSGTGRGSAPAAAPHASPFFWPTRGREGRRGSGRAGPGPGRPPVKAGASRPTVPPPRGGGGDTRRAATPPLGTGSPAPAGPPAMEEPAERCAPTGGDSAPSQGWPAAGAAAVRFEATRPSRREARGRA